MKNFAYYKNWALNHLKKQLEGEIAVTKSLAYCEMMLEKSFPVGTVREWKGKKYKKVAPGKWMRYYERQNRGSAQALRYAIKQLEKIEDMETLAKFINANRNRFCDEHGKPLPEAVEILRMGKEKAGGIKAASEKEIYQKLQEEFIEEIRTGKRDNTRELQEDVNFWKHLIKTGAYSGAHLEHIKKVVEIGEEELKKRKKKSAEKEKKAETSNTDKIELSDFPPEFSMGKRKKETQAFLDMINSQKNANPDVLKLYKNIGKIYDKTLPLEVKQTPKGRVEHYTVWVERRRRPVKQAIFLSKFDKELQYGNTCKSLHELMHMMDMGNRKDRDSVIYGSYDNEKLLNAVRNAKVTKEEIEYVKSLYKECMEKAEKYEKAADEISKELRSYGADYKKGKYTWEEYKQKFDEGRKGYDSVIYEVTKITNQYRSEGQLCDILDALTGGDLYNDGYPGHGWKTFSSVEQRVTEIVADIASLSVMKPELVEVLKKYQPELVEGAMDYFKSFSV